MPYEWQDNFGPKQGQSSLAMRKTMLRISKSDLKSSLSADHPQTDQLGRIKE
jgi:hypothetical protein